MYVCMYHIRAEKYAHTEHIRIHTYMYTTSIHIHNTYTSQAIMQTSCAWEFLQRRSANRELKHSCIRFLPSFLHKSSMIIILRVQICMNLSLNVCMYELMWLCMNVSMDVCRYKYIHGCMDVRMHEGILDIHSYLHVCIHACMHRM